MDFINAMADIDVIQMVYINAINPGLIRNNRFTRNIERVTWDTGISRDAASTFLVFSHRTAPADRPQEVGALVSLVSRHTKRLLPGFHYRWRSNRATIDKDGGRP